LSFEVSLSTAAGFSPDKAGHAPLASWVRASPKPAVDVTEARQATCQSAPVKKALAASSESQT
jgi:hypothetical protein